MKTKIAKNVSDAIEIVKMAAGPFVPSELAATISKMDKGIADAIPAACAMSCVSLKDGTGRVVCVA